MKQSILSQLPAETSRIIFYYVFMKTDLNFTGLLVLGQENDYFKPTGSTDISKRPGGL